MDSILYSKNNFGQYFRNNRFTERSTELAFSKEMSSSTGKFISERHIKEHYVPRRELILGLEIDITFLWGRFSYFKNLKLIQLIMLILGIPIFFPKISEFNLAIDQKSRKGLRLKIDLCISIITRFVELCPQAICRSFM